MKTLIIVPVLNESAVLSQQLNEFDVLRAMGAQVLLVDGGSNDRTVQLARDAGFDILESVRGRARQMNAGARAAQSDLLVFLHVDTHLPRGTLYQIEHHLNGKSSWGRFDVRIVGSSPWLKVISFCMNWRSRLTGIATGDQTIFMTREAFNKVGGFPEQPLMEDIEMSKRLKRLSPPVCLPERVVTSGRRWDQNGVWKTILLMWRLRWAYWRGVPASELARLYR
ncbi:MAG: TIGR04283 family arsenosugar biosynthesis glycosyltransferase [Burkholderiaceae bacterium]|nr:TIGR04283 family arsenosugar biosynthesis glycosyltransferase [Burkholderiaceae bacterium]MDP4970008.1 TIGR04283 family arsenosugar biosynthesis glycosyltransferase [Burkholderiaceae bacterium]